MTVTVHAAAVVLDIEGTTTPIAFVHDVLFGYARVELAPFFARHATEPDMVEITRALAAEYLADRDPDKPLPFAVEPYVHWLMDRDRKSTALKALQGRIWRGGYESGALRSVMYADVPPALAAWGAGGATIAIYSSGSVEAQRLLFRHSDRGDLTPLIDRYFDTTTGPKREAASYARIAATLGLAPDRIAFVSDVGEELIACREAGMQGVLALRPGNAPVTPRIASAFPSLERLDALTVVVR